VTHPFHPLHGKVLEVIDRRYVGDRERVYLEVEPDRVVALATAWTSLGPKEPFVTMAAGRSLFRVDDLVRLAELVSELDGQGKVLDGAEGSSGV
jgi:hypothetical protein